MGEPSPALTIIAKTKEAAPKTQTLETIFLPEVVFIGTNLTLLLL